jgi:hypothetical protein
MYYEMKNDHQRDAEFCIDPTHLEVTVTLF